MRAIPFLLRGFLLTVVDIMVIRIKFAHFCPFCSSIPKIGGSVLPSPAWPHPVYLDSWKKHFRFLCNIVLYSIGLYFHHQPQSTTEGHFHPGPAASLLLALLGIALCSSPVAYWTPYDLGVSSSIISFCLLIYSMGISRQEYWSGLLFLSPVGHVRTLHQDPPILEGPSQHGS